MRTPMYMKRRTNAWGTNLTNINDVYYIIDIEVGNQSIPVTLDTGSSDTWLVQRPYTCVSFWLLAQNSVSALAQTESMHVLLLLKPTISRR